MRYAIIFALLAFGMAPQLLAQDSACDRFDDGRVVNSDNEFIGRITNKFASDSIFNEFGRYGSQFRTESIWNQFGKNGSEYRANSAFNQFTRNPPRIFKDGELVGYLSANSNLRGAVNPIVLGAACYDFTPPR